MYNPEVHGEVGIDHLVLSCPMKMGRLSSRSEKAVKSLVSQIGRSIDMMGGYRNLSDGSDQPAMLINGEQVYQIRDDS